MADWETDRWAAGDLHEPYVGRWSRIVARNFLGWLDAPARVDWLDVGCGTGALTHAIAERCAPKRLVGVDPRLASSNSRENGRAASGPSSGRPTRRTCRSADRAVSGLVLNSVPDRARAGAEMARVVAAAASHRTARTPARHACRAIPTIASISSLALGPSGA